MADDSDLGSDLQPKQAGAMQMLSDPRIRNGLLSFAAQALTGSWGSPVSQAGMALGHGLASAGDTDTEMEKHKLEQQRLKQAGDIAAEHNKTQLAVAKMHADTLKDVTKTKTENKAAQDSPIWRAAYLAKYNDLVGNQGIDEVTRHATAMQHANEAVQTYMAIHGKTVPGSSMGETQPTPASPKGATGLNPAAAPAQPSPKASEMKGSMNDIRSRLREVRENIDQEKYKTDPKYRDFVEEQRNKVLVSRDKAPGGPVGSPLESLLQVLRPTGTQPKPPGAPAPSAPTATGKVGTEENPHPPGNYAVAPGEFVRGHDGGIYEKLPGGWRQVK
jgi:hypothetical protein